MVTLTLPPIVPELPLLSFLVPVDKYLDRLTRQRPEKPVVYYPKEVDPKAVENFDSLPRPKAPPTPRGEP